MKIGGTANLAAVDPERAEMWLEDLVKLAEAEGLARLASFCRSAGSIDRDRLGAVLALSPHLNSVVLRRPLWLDRLFDTEVDARIEAIVAGIARLPADGMSEAQLMTDLRERKLEASFLIALRDLFGDADGRRTTSDLSALADAAIAAAIRFALRDLDRAGKLTLPDPARPEHGCGLFVLGMGKLGAQELNYSSDVDLIVLFDPDAPAIVEREECVEVFSRLVRRLVRIIGERTGDGYVFRTDLRLRPDPGAMPLAIPVQTALAYYEARGRNWERAAMLKARCVAGDPKAARAFLEDVTPFVWRKYLDFNAVAEIQAMKRRIDLHHGYDGLHIAGHDLKLGRGGIREIEFFAQAQQLIAGGRAPELRLRRTEDALRALARGGWVSPLVADALIEAYWFLRRAEHAVQMVADEQSHTLPADEAGLVRIARLLGFPDVEPFAAALGSRLATVEKCFNELFAGPAAPVSQERNFSRLIDEGDIAGVAAFLAELGFSRAVASARVLLGWGGRRYRAMRSEAARGHLERVLPGLLRSLAHAPDPDDALIAFDSFLAGLPTGVQFFALIAANPKILDLLALIITAAPRLAATMSRRPHVFDALLDPTFFRDLPTRSLLQERLRIFMADAEDYEEQLVRLRLFASEQRFLIGTRLLSGAIGGEAAGLAFSDIADVVIEATLASVEAAFAARHGHVPGGRIALVGMGRLGSRELTAGSDIDLILFYDNPETSDESNGEKPLPAGVYYIRLTQRLIAALSAPMGEGILYEVDFRLRPSGNKGPLATHIEAFRRYQASEARTWERMALTRSRLVSGATDFGAGVLDTVRAILSERRDALSVGREVAAMRSLIAREKPSRGPLDMKLRRGGLVDLEFLAQWAILAGRVPLDLVGRPTGDVLMALERTGDFGAAELTRPIRVFTEILQLMRLGPGGIADIGSLPPRLAERIAAALEVEEAGSVEPLVERWATQTRAAFERNLPDEPPAAA